MKDEAWITLPPYLYFLHEVKNLLSDYIYLIFSATILALFGLYENIFIISYLIIYFILLIIVYFIISLPFFIWDNKLEKQCYDNYKDMEIINHELGHLFIAEYYYPGIFQSLRIYNKPKISSIIKTGWYTLGEVAFDSSYNSKLYWENKIKMYLAGDICNSYFINYNHCIINPNQLTSYLTESIVKDLNRSDLPKDHDLKIILTLFKENHIDVNTMEKLLQEYINEIINIFDENFITLFSIKKALLQQHTNISRKNIENIIQDINNKK